MFEAINLFAKPNAAQTHVWGHVGWKVKKNKTKKNRKKQEWVGNDLNGSFKL